MLSKSRFAATEAGAQHERQNPTANSRLSPSGLHAIDTSILYYKKIYLRSYIYTAFESSIIYARYKEEFVVSFLQYLFNQSRKMKFTGS